MVTSKLSGYLSITLGRTSTTTILSYFRTAPNTIEAKANDCDEIPQARQRLWFSDNDKICLQVQNESDTDGRR